MHCVCFSLVFSGALGDKEKIKWRRNAEINDIEDKSILESLAHGHRIKPGQLNSVWGLLLVWFGSHDSLWQEGNVVTATVCILPPVEDWCCHIHIQWDC